MTPTCSLVLWMWMIGVAMGAYGVTHLDAAFRDADALWAWTLREVHGTPSCPKGLVCSPKP